MIVSSQNRWLKDIRRLRRSKADQALIEGPHLLAAALAAGIDLEAVLVTPEFRSRDGSEALLAPLEAILHLVREDLLAAAADSDSPRGVAAIARLQRPGVEGLPRTPRGVYLYVDGVQEPGNLGALARVAEASGAAGLALAPESVHPNHPRALRASAGSLLRLPVGRNVSPQALDRHLAGTAPTWLALSPRGGEPLYEADLPRGVVVLAVGAEGPGLGSPALERTERRLTLPMCPPVESLNVTVAAALALFELARRRHVRDA
jgi:RNA methyltransferase, TrmH family